MAGAKKLCESGSIGRGGEIRFVSPPPLLSLPSLLPFARFLISLVFSCTIFTPEPATTEGETRAVNFSLLSQANLLNVNPRTHKKSTTGQSGVMNREPKTGCSHCSSQTD